MDSSVRKVKVDGHDFFGYVAPGALVFATLAIAIFSLWPTDPIVIWIRSALGPSSTLKAFHYISLSIAIILLCHVLGHIVATFSSLLFDRVLIGKIIKLPHERFVLNSDLCCEKHDDYLVARKVRDRPSLTCEEVKSAFSVIHYRVLFTLLFLAPLFYAMDVCPAGRSAKFSSFQGVSLFDSVCLVIAGWFGWKWTSEYLWNKLKNLGEFTNVFSGVQRKTVYKSLGTDKKATWQRFKVFCVSRGNMAALLYIYAFTFVCSICQLPLRALCSIFENLADQRKLFPMSAQLRFKEKYRKLFCLPDVVGTVEMPYEYDQEIWWAVYWYVLTSNDVIRERVEKFHTLYRFMRNCGFACLLSVPLMGILARDSRHHAVLFFVMAIALWGFAALFVLRYCYIYNEFFAKTVYRAFTFLPDPDPADKAKALCVYCQNKGMGTKGDDDEPRG